MARDMLIMYVILFIYLVLRFFFSSQAVLIYSGNEFNFTLTSCGNGQSLPVAYSCEDTV